VFLTIGQASIAPPVGSIIGFGEYTVGTKSFTGTFQDENSYSSCTHMKSNIHGNQCLEETTYQHAIILDKAHIDFDPITLSLTSNVGEPSMPAVAPASLAFAAHSWDAGDAGF
jgi:hypothetical protein